MIATSFDQALHIQNAAADLMYISSIILLICKCSNEGCLEREKRKDRRERVREEEERKR